MITHPHPSDVAAVAGPASTGHPVLIGRRTRLRGIEPGDRRTLAGFDRDLAGREPRVGGYRHWAAHRGGVEPGEDLQFAIVALGSGLLVGSVSTVRADERADRFSYGIGIGSRHRRCGYAADAITTLLAFMFGQRGYGACEVSVYGSNFASLTLHARLGFREEERLLDPELSHGELKHLVRLGITAAEFAERHPDPDARSRSSRSRRGRHWRNRRGRHWDGQDRS